MHEPLQREGNVLNNHERKTVQGCVIPEKSLVGIKWENRDESKEQGLSNSGVPGAGKDARAA